MGAVKVEVDWLVVFLMVPNSEGITSEELLNMSALEFAEVDGERGSDDDFFVKIVFRQYTDYYPAEGIRSIRKSLFQRVFRSIEG